MGIRNVYSWDFHDNLNKLVFMLLSMIPVGIPTKRVSRMQSLGAKASTLYVDHVTLQST